MWQLDEHASARSDLYFQGNTICVLQEILSLLFGYWRKCDPKMID